MPTDPNTVQSYSDYAEKWAAKMRSGTNNAHEFLEKPAMYGKLQDLKGKDVLCIGCGTGEECAYLKSLGVNRVVGTDISPGLIEIAKQSYPELEFFVMDMERLDFAQESFDIVYGSLVMHYVDDWKPTLDSVYGVLKSNGRFLFSTHHPASYGAEQIRTETTRASVLGYTHDKQANTTTVHGDYLNTKKIDDTWWGDFKLTYFHRSIESVMKDVLSSKFRLTDFLEPKALDAAKDKAAAFWQIHQKLPLFMIFELSKI
jgi:SAM-dependent methyltransferase